MLSISQASEPGSYNTNTNQAMTQEVHEWRERLQINDAKHLTPAISSVQSVVYTNQSFLAYLLVELAGTTKLVGAMQH